jgi:hypothetical protein
MRLMVSQELLLVLPELYDVVQSNIEQGLKLRFPCLVLDDFCAAGTKPAFWRNEAGEGRFTYATSHYSVMVMIGAGFFCSVTFIRLLNCVEFSGLWK